MRTLYFECNMGAAGDMLMASLYSLIDDQEDFLSEFHQLGLPHVTLRPVSAEKAGIVGISMEVKVGGVEEISDDVDDHNHSHDHDHSHIHDDHDHSHGHNHDHSHHEEEHDHRGEHLHGGYAEVAKLIDGLALASEIKTNAKEVYRVIAAAEAKAHNKAVDQVHFHEVGSLDAVADVVGCCMLVHRLNLQRIIASPIHVGSGQVRCAHGVLPVPAPATAEILRGIPTYSGEIRGELCTPTGAALLHHFVDQFSAQPLMVVEKIGYGMGKKDFPIANCVRAFLGESGDNQKECTIIEISCNIDDMTGEDLGYVMDLLMEQGALDVFFTPIQMKKNRPAVLLTCLCKKEDQEKMNRLILAHTTTFGLRWVEKQRIVMDDPEEGTSGGVIENRYGHFRVKRKCIAGLEKEKIEHDDLVEASKKTGMSIAELRKKISSDEEKN